MVWLIVLLPLIREGIEDYTVVEAYHGERPLALGRPGSRETGPEP